METTINQRIEMIMEHLKMYPADFSRLINVPRQKISNVITGKFDPKTDFLNALCEFIPTINIHWVITGKGKMLLSDNYNAPVSNQTIEEPISDLYMDANEIKDLKTLVKDLMATVKDQASTLKGYANAEEINAKARLNLTETIMSQERTIENLSQEGVELKKAVGDASK